MLDERLNGAQVGNEVYPGLYWLPVIIYAGLIFYVSSLSHPEEIAPLLLKHLSDKVAHGIEYGLLGVLCYRAFRYAAGAWGMRHALLLASSVSTGYGITDELHQAFVPFREPDGWDVLTDMAGATLGAVAWRWKQERHDSVIS